MAFIHNSDAPFILLRIARSYNISGLGMDNIQSRDYQLCFFATGTEAEWPGVRQDDRPTAATLLRPLPPTGGEETGAGAGARVERRGPSTTRVSSQLGPGLAAD
jgi:hypothetical protein